MIVVRSLNRRGNYIPNMDSPVRFTTTATKAVSARKAHAHIVDFLDGFHARSSSAQGSVAVQLENLAAALEQERLSQKWVVLGHIDVFFASHPRFICRERRSGLVATVK